MGGWRRALSELAVEQPVVDVGDVTLLATQVR
jgi:hypothetical protein